VLKKCEERILPKGRIASIRGVGEVADTGCSKPLMKKSTNIDRLQKNVIERAELLLLSRGFCGSLNGQHI
jgi:hypothetical protein